MHFDFIHVFRYNIFLWFQQQKNVEVISYLFNQSGRHGWLIFTNVIKVTEKMDKTIHIKTLSCLSSLYIPVWSTKHKEVKRVWFLYKIESTLTYLKLCQFLDFPDHYSSNSKHQPPCNVEIKTIRSFGWIS